MTALQFHFNAYALCTVETEEGYEPRAYLCGGFFASIEDAEKGADANELRIRGEHEQWCKRYPYQAAHTASGRPPERLHYEIVSLAHVQFDSLDALQTAIEQAAALQFNGVGKVAA